MGKFAWHAVKLDSVTVPGVVSAWITLSKQFGQLPFERLFKFAIHYAEQGFMVSPVVASHWDTYSKPFNNNVEFAKVFLPKGRPPKAGELFKAPFHANSLEHIAASQGSAFYRGQLAQSIVSCAKQQGGLLTQQDLSEHQCLSIKPLALQYRNEEVFELPPNGQGLTVLIALGILKHFDLSEFPADSAESIHLQIEAMNLAFADATRYIADPTSMAVSCSELLSPSYLASRAKLIDMRRTKIPSFGIPRETGTVYLATADASGMMVSFIQSHYLLFGSGVVIPNTGILMQNRGACFTLEHEHPNEVAPNRLPFHTILPGFLMKNQKPLMSFGCMGGHMQAQGHLQMVVRLCDYDQTPQSIIDAPRWYILPTHQISLEKGFKQKVVDALRAKGHSIVGAPKITFGGAQLIYRLNECRSCIGWTNEAPFPTAKETVHVPRGTFY